MTKVPENVTIGAENLSSKLIVLALFCYTALVNYNNLVCIADSLKTVCNHNNSFLCRGRDKRSGKQSCSFS